MEGSRTCDEVGTVEVLFNRFRHLRPASREPQSIGPQLLRWGPRGGGTEQGGGDTEELGAVPGQPEHRVLRSGATVAGAPPVAPDVAEAPRRPAPRLPGGVEEENGREAEGGGHSERSVARGKMVDQPSLKLQAGVVAFGEDEWPANIE